MRSASNAALPANLNEESNVTTPKANRMHQSTTLIPRLVSVVEIIKREYVKKLDPVLAEGGSLSGLHQYNEVGTLEERNEDDEGDSETNRLQAIAHALQSRNQ